jgi:hypothetical protein
MSVERLSQPWYRYRSTHVAASALLALTLAGCAGDGEDGDRPPTPAYAEVVATDHDGSTVISYRADGSRRITRPDRDSGSSRPIIADIVEYCVDGDWYSSAIIKNPNSSTSTGPSMVIKREATQCADDMLKPQEFGVKAAS